MVYWTQWFFGRLIELMGHIFYKLSFEGLEYLKECDLPVIFVSNHKSWIDHFIIIAGALRRNNVVPIHVLVADDIYSRPIIGAVCKLLGAYPARYKTGLDVSLAPLIQELREGECVGLYPEGKINRGYNEFWPPRPGAAWLANTTHRQIFPMAIRGLENFSWPSLFFSRRKITISYGRPLYLDKSLSIEESSDKIMATIVALYQSISS